MITYTEKERTWILCDHGEVPLGIGGGLEPSITPSMFIESPSSLDLMLGMQKRPSWDCAYTSTSNSLESKSVQQNVLKYETPPQHKRMRKASWSGGFEEQERPSNLDSAENAIVEGKGVGYTSIPGNICDSSIQHAARRKVLLESLQMEKSTLKKCGAETNKFLLSKKLNLDNVCVENQPQQCGTNMEENAKAKVPKFVTSLLNSRLKKRMKKLEASELEEKSHSTEFSTHVQGFKTTHNEVELLTPSNGRVDGEMRAAKSCALLMSTTFAMQASNGARAVAPLNSRASTSCKGISLANQGKNDLQVGALIVKRKETKDSVSAKCVGRPRRIRIVEHHTLEGGCLSTSDKTNFATNLLQDKETVLQTVSPVVKREYKKGCPKQLVKSNGSISSIVENAKGSSRPEKPQKAKLSLILGPSTSEPGHSGSIKGGFPGLGALPSSREGLLRTTISIEGPMKDNMNKMEGTLTTEDSDLVKGSDVRVRTKKLLQLFHTIHKQFRGGHKEVDVRNIIVECYPQYLVNGSESLYGEVPGVEAGDRFTYRVEMDLVGLHHHLRRGIDVIVASKSNWYIHGKPVSVAACIVVAGGYVDNRDEGDIIIYTGEGGNNHFCDKGPSKDQMLTFGNRALRHSLILGLYVRVVRKFDMKPPAKPYYRYDGLYEVMEMKKERSRGQKKTWSQGKHGDKKRNNKCKAVPFKPLVYKFMLVRKSTREKYKDLNLWSFKPPALVQNPQL